MFRRNKKQKKHFDINKVLLFVIIYREVEVDKEKSYTRIREDYEGKIN